MNHEQSLTHMSCMLGLFEIDERNFNKTLSNGYDSSELMSVLSLSVESGY